MAVTQCLVLERTVTKGGPLSGHLGCTLPSPHAFPNTPTVLPYFLVYFLRLSHLYPRMTHRIKESNKATQKHCAGTGKDLKSSGLEPGHPGSRTVSADD